MQNATRCSTSGEIRCPGTTRRRARQPRRPVSIRARQLANTAGTWDVSTHKTSACCLMLPAHQRDHRRQYTPVPDAPGSGHRKPDRQHLCRTSMRQRDIHHLRTTVQRLIHSEANRQRQFADSSTDSYQGLPNQGRRLSGIPLTSGLRTAKHR